MHTRHQRWDAGCGAEAAPQALELSEMLCRAGSYATEPGDHSAYVHLVGWLTAPPTTIGADPETCAETPTSILAAEYITGTHGGIC